MNCWTGCENTDTDIHRAWAPQFFPTSIEFNALFALLNLQCIWGMPLGSDTKYLWGQNVGGLVEQVISCLAHCLQGQQQNNIVHYIKWKNNIIHYINPKWKQFVSEQVTLTSPSLSQHIISTCTVESTRLQVISLSLNGSGNEAVCPEHVNECLVTVVYSQSSDEKLVLHPATI
jgi:hypothetical protein